MGGLVEYASSDDEESAEHSEQAQVHEAVATPHNETEKNPSQPSPATLGKPASPSSPIREQAQLPATAPLPQNATRLGPSLPSVDDRTLSANPDSTQEPSSPYSTERALIHDLTLPAVPNLDIPPSPRGSPPPSTNKKFEQFLELKRKGTHFNSKLEQSTALKNPSLMDKLLGFVEVEGESQYETLLSADLWNPQAFPEWAYRQRLRKTREKLAKEKEAEKASGGRSSIDFVASTTTTDSAASGARGTIRGDKRKSSWK